MRTETAGGQIPVTITSFSFYTFKLFPAGVYKAADEPNAVSLVFFWLHVAAPVCCRTRFMILTLHRYSEQRMCYRARYACATGHATQSWSTCLRCEDMPATVVRGVEPCKIVTIGIFLGYCLWFRRSRLFCLRLRSWLCKVLGAFEPRPHLRQDTSRVCASIRTHNLRCYPAFVAMLVLA